MDRVDSAQSKLDERVLFLTPTGRDGALLSRVLANAGLNGTRCDDVQTLAREIQRGVGTAIIAQEALIPRASQLLSVLREQPAWSDIPVILLVSQGDELADLGHEVSELGNLLIAERPIGAEVLLSLVRSALESRRRQYLVREHLLLQLQSAELLREERERFQTLVDSLPQPVWTCDARGECDFVSPQWSAYTGASLDDSLGDGWLRFVHPEDRRATRRKWAQAQQCLRFDVQFRLRRADGRYRWFTARATPLLTDAGRVRRWVATCTDIEVQKASEAVLVEANRSKDELLALVSHELRTPLTQIIGAAEILRARDSQLSVETREALQTDILRESRRLQQRIENMLVLAKSELDGEVTIEPFLLDKVLGRVIDDIRSTSPGRQIEASVEVGGTPVLGNAIFSEQILFNVLRNSDKYSDPEHAIEVEAFGRESRVSVTVADRGRTYSSAEIQQMFGVFYRDERSARRVSGLGLGLPVCRRLAEAQGGTIDARPRHGGGLEVELTLPIANLNLDE